LWFGMLWARSYRDVNEKINDVPKWFYVHRITQYTGFVLSIIGWVIALIMVEVHYSTQFHAQLGTAVLGLVILQVFCAYYRPHPVVDGAKSKLRILFEYQHVWTGRLALLLSIPVIASGIVEIEAPFSLLIAYITVALFFLFLILSYELFKFITDWCDENDNSEEELEALNQPVVSTSEPSSLPVDSSSPPPSLRKQAPFSTPAEDAVTVRVPSLTPRQEPTALQPPPVSPFTRSPFVPQNQKVVVPTDGGHGKGGRNSDDESEEEDDKMKENEPLTVVAGKEGEKVDVEEKESDI